MQINLLDKKRGRKIPVCIYLPNKKRRHLPVVIFNAGYQSQEELAKSNMKLRCTDYKYLANFFNSKGFAFVSIQHEILGDNDGIEIVDRKIQQNNAS